MDRLLHRSEHGVPGDPERHRDLLPAHAPRPTGEKPREAGGHALLAAGPGDHLDGHRLARRARDPAHCVQEVHHDTPQRHELEPTLVQRVVGRPRRPAVRAQPLAALPRPDLDVDLLLRPHPHELDPLVDEALVFLDGIEQSLDQHREPLLGRMIGCVVTPLYTHRGAPVCLCRWWPARPSRASSLRSPPAAALDRPAVHQHGAFRPRRRGLLGGGRESGLRDSYPTHRFAGGGRLST